MKATGKPSAGNRHAGFDEAGAGNVPTGAGLRPGAKAPDNPPAPTGGAPAPDPTDERRLETEPRRGVRHRHRESRRQQLPPPPTATAPVVDSTPRARVPTQVRVARTQPQRRRHEAQHPHRARFRLHQIRQTTARRPRPAERMRRLQQPRAPLPRRGRVRHQQPDLAQLLQAATERRQFQSRPVHARPATAPRRTRLGRRQRHAQLPRQVRQRLASRRRAQLPPRVAPPVHRAQSASQGRTRQLPPTQLLAEPLDRLRLQDAQTNSARSTFYTEPPACVNCD